jgi:hypothetical protein
VTLSPLTFFLHTTNPELRAVAERPSTATTLERLGYTRCDYATFKLDWQAEDRERAIRLFGPVLHNPYDS